MDSCKSKIFMLVFYLFTAVSFLNSSAQHQNFKPFWELPQNEAQNILKNLTLREKVGQLFMIGAFSFDGVPCYWDWTKTVDRHLIKTLIRKHHIGGLMFMQGSPEKQIKLANHYQSISKLPLLFAQDCEWGLAMRLENSIKYPHNMTLGAIQDNNLIYKLGQEIGRQCSFVGIHVNFAPVVDINNNPQNPVINDRSFGENKEKVTQKSIAFIQGLQDAGIFACAKHFPGHGNTSTDSHLDLPIINKTLVELKKTELYPFEKAFENGVQAVMVAHLHIPALDDTPNRPSSLSPEVVTNLLQKQMNFKGLIFTDALNMEAITKHQDLAEAALGAFLAGADVLLMNPGTETVLSSKAKGELIKKVPFFETLEKIENAIELLVKKVKAGEILEEEIDRRILKILLAKQWLKLFEKQNITKEVLFENAVTLVKDDPKSLPLTPSYDFLNRMYIGLVSITKKNRTKHNRTLENQVEQDFFVPDEIDYEEGFTQRNGLASLCSSFECFRISPNASEKDFQKISHNLTSANAIIVAIYDMNKLSSQNWGITNETLRFLQQVNEQAKQLQQSVILVLFGSPYSLKLFENQVTIIVAYEEGDEAEMSVAKIINGKIKPKGKLPVTASEKFKEGDGLIF